MSAPREASSLALSYVWVPGIKRTCCTQVGCNLVEAPRGWWVRALQGGVGALESGRWGGNWGFSSKPSLRPCSQALQGAGGGKVTWHMCRKQYEQGSPPARSWLRSNAPYCHDLVPGSFLLSPEAACLPFSGFSFPVLIGLADLDENTAKCSLSSSGTELPRGESEAQFIKENENHSLVIHSTTEH